MIVAIQQPEHLPWIGFFNKLARCDRFVLLDNVQFKKRYFENRNRIRSGNDARWVTVPVLTKGRYTQSIRDVRIDNTTPWSGRYWRSVVHAYARAPYFREYAPAFEALLQREWDRLVDLNVALIEQARSALAITTGMTSASDVVTDDDLRGSALLLEICRTLGATGYVSGPDGRSYLDLDAFAAAGIDVVYHDYEPPTYDQGGLPFVSHLSIVDLLFHAGPRSRDLVLAEA